MSFDQYETSTQDGRPVVLYHMKWGNTEWRYTSADSVQFYPDQSQGNDFQPLAIRDDGMVQGGSNENDFLLYMQTDAPLVALYADSPPTTPVWITVRRRHPDDALTEAPVYFVGRIVNVLREENTAEATVRCVASSRLLKAGGLRLTWGKNCPHCVYDSACRVNPIDHQYSPIIETVTGTTFSTAQDMVAEEGSFTGGFIEWDRDGLGTMEMRGIEAQLDSKNFRVLGRLPGLIPGAVVNMYPGCDQTTSTCSDGFDNIDNNGGFPFMPEKSPFDGSQVFG